MNKMQNLIFVFIAGAVWCSVLYAQGDEASTYKNTSAIDNTEKRIEALKDFVTQYPSGKLLGRAYSDLFRLYTHNKNESEALKYAELYINTYPEESRMNPYNSAAYTLAENKIGLKQAAEYAQKAVDLAQSVSTRKLREILDTQALVLFELGYADSALALEREAIKGNESDPTYLYYLAIYEEATGLRIDALNHTAQAMLYGDGVNAPLKFDEWLKKEKLNAEEQKLLKEKIVKDVADAFVKDADKSEIPLKQSAAAAFMAKMDVDLNRAKKMALSALKSLNKNVSLEQTITIKTNLAVVYLEMNDYKKSLDELQSVQTFVSPYDGEYWFTMGQAFEKLGEPQKALKSYVQGLFANEHPKVKNAADELIQKNSIDANVLAEKINAEREKARNFHPGKFERNNSSGRAVLAELFTGAECNPCIASDYAFDKLEEYYSRTDLIILEYHVHIPGPDPLTNPDSYKRYTYYSGDFGTPTVFFDGGDKITGGGSILNMPNRFQVFNHSVNTSMKIKPSVTIKGTTSLNSKNMIKVALELKSTTPKNAKDLSVHVALVEKSVNYTGANGVNKHIFVVRDLVNGAKGEPIKLKKKSITYSASIDLNEVRKGISDYLDDPTKDVSWRGSSFGGWRERTDSLDEKNLAVVAWVQNNKSKEILQSYYMDVTSSMSMK